MAAKGISHETAKGELHDWIAGKLPSNARLMIELGSAPDGETYCEPDLIAFPRKFRPFSTVPAAEVMLLIEVADSTLKFDSHYQGIPLFASRCAGILGRERLHDRDVRPSQTGSGRLWRRQEAQVGHAFHTAPRAQIAVRISDLGLDPE